MHFAAANAEAQFVIAPRPEVAASVIAATRDLLPKYGRSREDLKFFQGLSFVIGSTEEEAARKSRELDEAIDAEAMIAHLGGAMDVGLDDYSLDYPISDIQTDGS
jgi:alkanesulfonate monooxygenase SsuD/methylene tetrahydromethanopterin reductase-like flavin-dependent oxidoreductase (luciferase family)